jgi:hypothetical protein
MLQTWLCAIAQQNEVDFLRAMRWSAADGQTREQVAQASARRSATRKSGKGARVPHSLEEMKTEIFRCTPTAFSFCAAVSFAAVIFHFSCPILLFTSPPPAHTFAVLVSLCTALLSVPILLSHCAIDALCFAKSMDGVRNPSGLTSIPATCHTEQRSRRVNNRTVTVRGQQKV